MSTKNESRFCAGRSISVWEDHMRYVEDLERKTEQRPIIFGAGVVVGVTVCWAVLLVLL